MHNYARLIELQDVKYKKITLLDIAFSCYIFQGKAFFFIFSLMNG